MKKVVIVCPQSVVCGNIENGVAELCDTLALTLAEDPEYRVTVITKDGGGVLAKKIALVEPHPEYNRFKLLNVTYLAVAQGRFEGGGKASGLVLDLIESENPSVLHAICPPGFLPEFSCFSVCTFDHKSEIEGALDALPRYDAVTTVSASYAAEVIAQGGPVAEALSALDFRGIDTGIVDTVFDPRTGLAIPAKYDEDNTAGKGVCRASFLRRFGIADDGRALFLWAGRMTEEKGFDLVLDSIDAFPAASGRLVVAGRGDPDTEARLASLAREGRLSWIRRRLDVPDLFSALSGCDFFLAPSRAEPCGLTAMQAARYGCVPICAPVGGLRDHFDDSCAVMIGDGGLPAAVLRAGALLRFPSQIRSVMRAAMTKDFGIRSRIGKYKEVYGL